MDFEKLRENFPNTTVLKDQSLVATFRAASIPAFLRDWILKKKAGPDGRIHDLDELRRYVDTIIPRRDQVLAIKDAARCDGVSRKFLARVEFRFKTGKYLCNFVFPSNRNLPGVKLVVNKRLGTYQGGIAG